jgi:hypothetical protein
MRKVILSVLFFVVILGLIGAAFTKHGDTPQHPTSISNGLTYEIPRKHLDRFYLTGLHPRTTHVLRDFLNNSVTHPELESTQLLYDGDLMADSSIMYTSPVLTNPNVVTLHLRGNLDPKRVRAYLRRPPKRTGVLPY